ncbi:MAG TPA: SRPBCC domain-containing protein [Rhizomicrobium sp.]|nr:SRPBCC domain-containing protein [Rhizomicrobium sp.]
MTAALNLRNDDIVVDELFPHAPETIWKTLTDGALMARWLGMTPTGFAPVKGNRFTYKTTPAGKWDGTIACEVMEVIPNERFVYAWRGGDEANTGYGSRLDTVVTFTLKKADGGTRLRLVHSGFVLPKNKTAYDNMSGGWKKVVGRIGDLATERK